MPRKSKTSQAATTRKSTAARGAVAAKTTSAKTKVATIKATTAAKTATKAPVATTRRKAVAKSATASPKVASRAVASKSVASKANGTTSARGNSAKGNVASASKTARRPAATAAKRSPARTTTQPNVIPIRDKHVLENGIIQVRPIGIEVEFVNLVSKAKLLVSRNIASTVEKAFNILIPKEQDQGRLTGTTTSKSNSTAKATSTSKDFYDGLIAGGVIKSEEVSLTPVRVNVDRKHPNRIVDGSGLPIVAFEIRIGEDTDVIGHLLAITEHRLTINAPDLQTMPSNHTSVNQAVVRIRTVAQDLIKRRANLTSGLSVAS